MNRRGFMNVVTGGLAGSIVGYYAGAKQLLGLQGTRTVVRERPSSTDSTSNGDSTSQEDSTPHEDSPSETTRDRQTSTAADGREGGFVDRFDRSRLSDLVVETGEKRFWDVTEGIEGRSLLGTGGDSKGTAVAYDTTPKSTTGRATGKSPRSSRPIRTTRNVTRNSTSGTTARGGRSPHRSR